MSASQKLPGSLVLSCLRGLLLFVVNHAAGTSCEWRVAIPRTHRSSGNLSLSRARQWNVPHPFYSISQQGRTDTFAAFRVSPATFPGAVRCDTAWDSCRCFFWDDMGHCEKPEGVDCVEDCHPEMRPSADVRAGIERGVVTHFSSSPPAWSDMPSPHLLPLKRLLHPDRWRSSRHPCSFSNS